MQQLSAYRKVCLVTMCHMQFCLTLLEHTDTKQHDTAAGV